MWYNKKGGLDHKFENNNNLERNSVLHYRPTIVVENQIPIVQNGLQNKL